MQTATVHQCIRTHLRALLLSIRDARDWRPLVFLAVLTFHAAFVALILHSARMPISRSTLMSEPLLLLLLLPHKSGIADDFSPSRHSASQPPAAKSHPSKPDAETSNAPTPPPEPPKIDWEKEAALATQNAIANANKENGYRNLSALSPEQLRWVRENQLVPAPPGIAWTYRHVEITQSGFPIIHINDHCVAIPFLMMMVFCKIGRIEPNGDLFAHMRDRNNP
jgi:hypothetical protein